jgi:hypothetical protein
MLKRKPLDFKKSVFLPLKNLVHVRKEVKKRNLISAGEK